MLNFRIGLLLGIRQIQRASLWATLLIVTVIVFTFLNLVAVSGLLQGIVDGAVLAINKELLGDITVTPLPNEDHILETERFARELKTFSSLEAFSVRYKGIAILEANYKERRDLRRQRDVVAVTITGINPIDENATTHLQNSIVEGEYLTENDQGSILVGKYFVKRYAEKFGGVFDSLENIYPGDSVRLTIGTVTKEFIVRGIVDSKVDEVSLSVFINEKEFRRLYDRANHNADEISIRLNPGEDEFEVSAELRKTSLSTLATIESFTEARPKFITDIKDTFDLLGLLIGAIGIVVASITVFIIIFINALSRRRHIGILKAVGIKKRVIEYAYVTQAAFYAFAGSLLGLLITYLILIPYFRKNPIDFPFSDVIISASIEGTMLRFATLFIVTLVAGFFPAWMIVRQNTLDSILGRK
ncbi:MAG: FtsX-like permease family protein [Minisyncoccia bacterium]